MVRTKKELAIRLSKVLKLEKPLKKFEQYETPSEIAAEMAWIAYQEGNVKDKEVCDLGCGTGILSIACGLLKARKVFGFDIDEEALKLARKNAEIFRLKNCKFIKKSFEDVNRRFDCTIMNPPFGRYPKHKDREFLQKAFQISDIVYSLHPSHSRKAIEKFALRNKFETKLLKEFNFPIKKTFIWHKKRILYFKASLLKFQKFQKLDES